MPRDTNVIKKKELLGSAKGAEKVGYPYCVTRTRNPCRLIIHIRNTGAGSGRLVLVTDRRDG